MAYFPRRLAGLCLLGLVAASVAAPASAQVDVPDPAALPGPASPADHAASTNTATPVGVAVFVRDRHLTRYTVALTDLNGDGRPEALIYALATADGDGHADLCGSGGCFLYVLSLTPGGYRRVTNISITRPPIRVLPTVTHGWHDLGVLVAGGGIIPGYEARLRFDGHSYPSNPSIPPATRLRTVIGKQVIGTEASILTAPAIRDTPPGQDEVTHIESSIAGLMTKLGSGEKLSDYDRHYYRYDKDPKVIRAQFVRTKVPGTGQVFRSPDYRNFVFDGGCSIVNLMFYGDGDPRNTLACGGR